ncbi:hypothetical protein [Paracraurococcus lichenis]|uniref:Uncharacterized protein n=1 Tax=Paracraurococcus lichenis TaxID=3064888 RepID=A0ABT9EAS4_9PROT|nr:hypothetical protein [Paracraurococcus sp. LOR1-02]MDO9713306.1 hypothetical protein [Paracraurococcus sp. LOR1-02]
MSTAYYALFHKVLQAGAERFMGPGARRSGGYGLIYRSFNHGRMRQVCEALTATRLSATVQRQLGRTVVSQDMRDFAAGFANLQELRHQADYDPSSHFPPSIVGTLVDTAEVTMAAFDRTTPDEQVDVLALMLTSPRG